MIYIKSFNKALKSTWVKKYLDNDNQGKWKLHFDSELHNLGGNVIFKRNLHKNDLAKFIHISDAFITELLKIWSEISYDGNITSSENLLSLGIQNIRHLIKDADNLSLNSRNASTSKQIFLFITAWCRA